MPTTHSGTGLTQAGPAMRLRTTTHLLANHGYLVRQLLGHGLLEYEYVYQIVVDNIRPRVDARASGVLARFGIDLGIKQ